MRTEKETVTLLSNHGAKLYGYVGVFLGLQLESMSILLQMALFLGGVSGLQFRDEIDRFAFVFVYYLGVNLCRADIAMPE